MYVLVPFFVISIIFTLLSRGSLRDRHRHGFYRYFAFEVLLLLFLMNVRDWFREPFSLHQILSGGLLLASLILVVDGFYLLKVAGKPRGQIENTSRLVTQGIYHYIRHPLYASLLLFGWGVCLKHPVPLAILLAILATLLLVATARVEEQENLAKFGTEYVVYKTGTRMFIPFLF
jgi:protein-S-isoprenylcysteine O-methyltransferase Ste14